MELVRTNGQPAVADRYFYWVTFSFNTPDGQSGTGSMEIGTDGPLTRGQQVMDLAATIAGIFRAQDSKSGTTLIGAKVVVNVQWWNLLRVEKP